MFTRTHRHPHRHTHSSANRITPFHLSKFECIISCPFPPCFQIGRRNPPLFNLKRPSDSSEGRIVYGDISTKKCKFERHWNDAHIHPAHNVVKMSRGNKKTFIPQAFVDNAGRRPAPVAKFWQIVNPQITDEIWVRWQNSAHEPVVSCNEKRNRSYREQ